MVWTMVSACATLGEDDLATEGNEHSTKEQVKETPQVYGVNNKELELKLTKLWARVDEMEGELIRHKEKIRLLEKGLLTGIAPVELSNPVGANKKASREALQLSVELEAPEKDLQDKKVLVDKNVPADSNLPARDDVIESDEDEFKSSKDVKNNAAPAPARIANSGQYQEEFAKAEKLYKEKHWGQAIAAYGALNVFPDEVTHGHHLFWTGMSWFNLREYQLATKHFEEFIQKFPGESLVGRAHLHIAKGDLQMGFVEKGVNRLKNVMRDFPADEAAKMAKWEMSRIEQTL